MTIPTLLEKKYLRFDGQASKLYAAFRVPSTIFAAQVNQTFASLDEVITVIYNNVTTGAYGDIIPGQTCWVGSAPGKYDLGICRIRKAADATHIYPGEHSDIKWANDVYITIVDDIGFWPKHIRMTSDGTAYVDQDIAYTDQHKYLKPIIICGGDMVVKRTGLTVTITDLELIDSVQWATVAGTTISAYSVSAPTSSASSGMTTHNPSITFDSDGWHKIAITITYTTGKSNTRYIWIFVWSDVNPPHPVILSRAPSVMYERGGWDFDIELTGSDADLSSIPPGSKIILFAEDFYGADNQISIGPLPGRENIKCEGWITGENLTIDPNGGKAVFTLEGPQGPLDQESCFTFGLELTQVAGDSTAWTNQKNLTVDKALHHLAVWSSTLSDVTDIYPTLDTRKSEGFQIPAGSIFSQIREIMVAIMGSVCCNRYGQIFPEIPIALTPPASRSSIPLIMELTKEDHSDEVTAEYHTQSKAGQDVLSGVVIISGVEGHALFSLSPGHVPKRFGNVTPNPNLLLSTQAQANELSGLILGHENRAFDFHIPLVENNMFIDVCPRAYLGFTIAATDTPRGVTYSGNLIPVSVTDSYDDVTKFYEVEIDCEPETFAENNTNGDIPDPDGGFPLDNYFPSFRLPKLKPFPPITPIVIPTPDINVLHCVGAPIVGYGIAYTLNFLSSPPNWYLMNDGLDPSDVGDIVNFEMSATGKCYCHGGSTENIYFAPYPGATWTKLIGAADLQAIYTAKYGVAFDTIDIFGFGINRGADDEIAIVTRAQRAFRSQNYVNFLIGNSDPSSFQMGTEIDMSSTGGHNCNYYGYWINGHLLITYGSNAWTSFMSFFTTEYFAVDRNGNTILSTYPTTHAPVDLPITVRGNKDGRHLLIWDLSEFSTSPDNGASFTPLTTPELPFEGSFGLNRFQSAAADPTGQYILLGQSVVPQRSPDYGATWTPLPSLGGLYEAVWNLGTPMDWIIAGNDGIDWFVQYTPDFGDTFQDKSGNIAELSQPTFHVVCLRSF